MFSATTPAAPVSRSTALAGLRSICCHNANSCDMIVANPECSQLVDQVEDDFRTESTINRIVSLFLGPGDLFLY